MSVYQNKNYKIEVVDNPEEDQQDMFPKLYRVTNTVTDVVEVYETMYPKALSYVSQASDAVDMAVDGPPQIVTPNPEAAYCLPN